MGYPIPDGCLPARNPTGFGTGLGQAYLIGFGVGITYLNPSQTRPIAICTYANQVTELTHHNISS
ncbi:hypothetical protein HanRHA438_Chr17g0803331 [Helianthus annuus]|nr:hypothetical protein HanRHA438_Chr17g0803331 [Helianthus annuus]